MPQNNFQGPQRQQASWQDPSLPPPYSLHPPTTPLEPQSVENWWNIPQHQASLPEKTLQHEQYPSENPPLYQENPPGYTLSLGGHPTDTSSHGGQNSMEYYQTSHNSSPQERSSHHGSERGGQRREKHHHRSHKPSRRERSRIDASTHGSQRRDEHHNSYRSSQREGSSCQVSETSAPSQDGGSAPPDITEDHGVDDESSAPKATMGEHGLTKGNYYQVPRFPGWVEQSPGYTAVRGGPCRILPS